jgi:hypothetical protein
VFSRQKASASAASCGVIRRCAVERVNLSPRTPGSAPGRKSGLRRRGRNRRTGGTEPRRRGRRFGRWSGGQNSLPCSSGDPSFDQRPRDPAGHQRISVLASIVRHVSKTVPDQIRDAGFSAEPWERGFHFAPPGAGQTTVNASPQASHFISPDWLSHSRRHRGHRAT